MDGEAAIHSGNYQEIDRQLKEQFIHGLNNTEMLGEIIRELTKAKRNVAITSENVLTWAKRAETQSAQSAVMSTITEVNNFDKIKVAKYVHKDTAKRTTQNRTLKKQTGRYCSSTHP